MDEWMDGRGGEGARVWIWDRAPCLGLVGDPSASRPACYSSSMEGKKKKKKRSHSGFSSIQLGMTIPLLWGLNMCREVNVPAVQYVDYMLSWRRVDTQLMKGERGQMSMTLPDIASSVP